MKPVLALLVVSACGDGSVPPVDDAQQPCAPGTLLEDTIHGDCARPVCDDNGGVVLVHANDPPPSLNPCVITECDDAFPQPAHHPCMVGAEAGVCTGNGTCVGCLDGSDCASGTCGLTTTDGFHCMTSGCQTFQLLISEIRTSGTSGADDEFVELYNTTSQPFDLTGFTLEARSDTSNSYTVELTGAALSIPANHYFLIAGSAYSGTVTPDASLAAGLSDNVSVVLRAPNNNVADAVCVYSGADPFTGAAVPYTCEGTPFLRAAAVNTDSSIQRKPGGAAGNCLDHEDNNIDWQVTAPAGPQDLASAPIVPQ